MGKFTQKNSPSSNSFYFFPNSFHNSSSIFFPVLAVAKKGHYERIPSALKGIRKGGSQLLAHDAERRLVYMIVAFFPVCGNINAPYIVGNNSGSKGE